MAAGLGFKTFTTGEVLTAADVNGYLMQGVLVFADAAARTSAITSPQEGQYSFLKDTNALEYYDGAAWVGAPVGDITAVNAGTGITGGGASGSVTITNDMATTITAAGDIVVGTGNATYDNLPIGTTGQVLTADTTVSPYKVKWASASAPSFVGCSLVSTNPVTTLTNNTYTTLAFDGEQWDTDGFHSNTTNNTRITIPTGKGGKYLFIYKLVNPDNNWGTPTVILILRTNGNTDVARSAISLTPSTNTGAELIGSVILDIPAGDYVEFRAFQNSGSNRTPPYSNNVNFQCQYLGA